MVGEGSHINSEAQVGTNAKMSFSILVWEV